MHDQDPDLVPQIRQQKQALRQRLRAQRVSLAHSTGGRPESRESLAVANSLDGVVRWPVDGCVAVYAPVRGELDPGPIAALARLHKNRLAYPRITREGRLAFHLVTDFHELAPDQHGIPAPSAAAPTASSIDVFVVPGLGFDTRGHRLGSGRGYYDMALREMPAALRIGVGYDWQVLPALPTEPHDEPLDVLATPSAGLVTRARPACFAGLARLLCSLPYNKEESP